MPSAGLIALDVGLIVLAAVAIGASAPRWPNSWLISDAGPLRFAPWESPSLYRSIGAASLARRLPELGAAFGGASKSRIADTSWEGLLAFGIELRRAEWVHWLSSASAVALFLFNPWSLALVFVLLTFVVNAPFIAVLRHNRLRVRRITQGWEAGHGG